MLFYCGSHSEFLVLIYYIPGTIISEGKIDSNVIFFGTYSSNNLPVPAIIMNMPGLIEEWRWRNGEGGCGVV
jgi:hypothetical protein